MLGFVGLGLSGAGLSIKGLDFAKSADVVYAEFYTSLIPGLDLKELEDKIDNSINVLDRAGVEQNPEDVIEDSKDKKVAFLIPGDPMIATTHVDLRLRLEREGIDTRIIHGPSIETAAAGEAGLQSYKFGKSATLPFPEKRSVTPYDVLEKNQESGLHTLFLLDIEAEDEKYLTGGEGIGYLLDLEEELGRNVFTEDSLVLVVARADSEDCLVRGGSAGELKDENFGNPPHVLIVPGNLHFLEAEALQELAGVKQELVKRYVEE